MNSDLQYTFEELVAICIGEASVCWDKNGVFQSEKACRIVDKILKRYNMEIAVVQSESDFYHSQLRTANNKVNEWKFKRDVAQGQKEELQKYYDDFSKKESELISSMLRIMDERDSAIEEAKEFRQALKGFQKFCIKPECECFACAALAQFPEKNS